jgi:hypothetical protein
VRLFFYHRCWPKRLHSIPVFSTALRGLQRCAPFFITGADDPDKVGMSACRPKRLHSIPVFSTALRGSQKCGPFSI